MYYVARFSYPLRGRLRSGNVVVEASNIQDAQKRVDELLKVEHSDYQVSSVTEFVTLKATKAAVK